MPDYDPTTRRADRRSPRGRVVTQPPRVRTTGRAAGQGATVVIAAVAIVALLGVGGYFGWKALVKPKTSSASSQAAASTATNAATAPASTSGGTKLPATGTAKPTASTSAGSGATGSASSAAWRNADSSWMEKFRGKYLDGFVPEKGYKAVALTFDDGPNGETQYVIDTIKKVGGQATFFDTGRKLVMTWAKTQPSIIEKAGFELGNHTQHHTLPDGISSMWHRSYATDVAEIKGPDQIIQSYGGQPTVWLRPMGGMIDATGIKAAVDNNHLVINWTIDSNDSHGGPRTPDYIYTQVTSNIKSGDVVLMHVTHPESMKALPRIVATLNERGFKLVTLSELAQHSTGAITQRIPN